MMQAISVASAVAVSIIASTPTPPLTAHVALAHRAGGFTLGEGVQRKSQLRSVRGRLLPPSPRSATGDNYAAVVLAQNTASAFFIEDVPDNFIFGTNPQPSGANLLTGDTTQKIDVETQLGPGMRQLEVHILTDTATDWLPVGVDPDGSGNLLTSLRIDVGAFSADTHAALGADAPLQWVGGGSFNIVSVEVAAFGAGVLLGSGPIPPAGQDNTNGLAASAGFSMAAGAGIDELAIVWVITDTAAGGDCNANGVADTAEIAANPALDCDVDGQLDSCQIAANPALDCDVNGQLDSCQIAANPSLDCDMNGQLDSCQIAATPALDLNNNGVIDGCELPADCNGNGIADIVEIALNPALDCDLDGQLDSCQIAITPALDLNGNGVIDGCELLSSCIGDVTGNGVVNAADLAELLGSWGPCP